VDRASIRKYRGPLLIHASNTRSSYDRAARLDWSAIYGVTLPKWEELVVGAIVGVVELVNCLPASQVEPSTGVEGPVCWVLANPRAFSNPITLRGAQGPFVVYEQAIPVEVN
jgi:hypothetical protein